MPIERLVASFSRLALAALLLGSGCAPPTPVELSTELFGELQRLAAGSRLVEPRLTGLPHAPLAATAERITASDLPDPTAARLRRLSRDAHRLAQTEPSAESHHVAALSLLVANTAVHVAIAKLREALALSTNEAGHSGAGIGRPASIRADLAAALWIHGTREGELIEVAEALDLVATDPVSDAGRFNRALALASIGLRSAALAAWQEVGEKETDPRWGAEAARRLAQLAAPTPIEAWEETKQGLERLIANGDSLPVMERVRASPQLARRWGEEELLARWAAAVVAADDDEAERALTTAEGVGEALRVIGGDQMLAATVSTIRRAAPDSRRQLAGAHKAYADGLAALAVDRVEEARDLFSSASRVLDGQESPFVLRADIQLAICAYYDFDAGDRTRELLRAIEDRADAARFPVIVARTHWILGLLEYRRTDPSAAFGHFQQAAALLEPLDEGENLAVLRYLEAEALDRIGAQVAGWRQRTAGVARLRRVERPHNRLKILYDLARAFERSDLRHAVEHVQDARIEIARAAGNPTDLGEAHFLRARTRRELGDDAGARADLAAARAAARRIEHKALRGRLLADTARAEGELDLEARRFADAIGWFDEAQSYYEELNTEVHVAELATLRARGFRGRGEHEGAEAELRRAQLHIDSQVRREPDPARRMTIRDLARPLLDESMTLLSETSDGMNPALELLESHRIDVSAGFLDDPSLPPPSLEQIVASVPEGVGAVVYFQLPDRLLAWVVVDDRVSTYVWLGVTRRLRALLEDRRDPPVDDATLSELYDLLLRPLAERLGSVDRLVFVPDRLLHGVPFAALRLRGDESYLIERYGVSTTPSLFFLEATSRRPRRQPEEMRLLAFGAPPPGASALAGLEHLVGAREELEAVAEAFGDRGRLVAGAEATKERFFREVTETDILYLATHAVQDPDEPLRGFLLVAPTPGVPESTFLSAHDLLRQRYDHLDRVILAACSTGRGSPDFLGGAPPLPRVLFSQGAPSAAVALWELESRGVAGISRELIESLLVRDNQGGGSEKRAPQVEVKKAAPLHGWLWIGKAESSL